MDLRKPRVLKFTKILCTGNDLSGLENGLFSNIRITGYLCMPYFNPTINFNMLQYISSTVSQITNPQDNLLAGSLVVLNNLFIYKRLKYKCMPFSKSDHLLIVTKLLCSYNVKYYYILA